MDDGISSIDRPLVTVDVGRIGEKALIVPLQERPRMAMPTAANVDARVLFLGIFRVIWKIIFFPFLLKVL